MTAQPFTPGPWRWTKAYKTEDGRETWTLVSDAYSYGILSCDGMGNSPQGLNDFGNAGLIEAALENYECNVELAQIVRELCAAYGQPLPQASLDRSDAAIAKARGEVK